MAPRTPKDPEAKAARPAKSGKAAAVATPAEKPALRVVAAGDKGTGGGSMKLKDLVDQVAEATGGKRAEIKPVIEAMLSAVGLALAGGKALALPPLGKLRVVKDNGTALTLKLRRTDGPKAAGLALADDGEDG